MSEDTAPPWHADTIVLHAGYDGHAHQRSAAVPIYQTTSFLFENAQQGADLFDLEEEGHIYARTGNPTQTVLEERIALIDRFIKLFGKECIDCISADREFVGEKWIAYLNREQIRYYLRIRNNFKVYLPRKDKQIPVSWLFSGLAVGEVKHYHRIVKVNGEYCYISATMSQKRE